VIILELPKVPAEDDGTAIWPWMHFFKCRKLEEFDMLAAKHPEVSGPVAEIKRLSWSERRRMIADAREKIRRDNVAMLEYAKERGIAEGRTETARKMKAMGLSMDTISEATGLSHEEIARM
jgi:predicted transposase/invertase (TIGR01784 family)